MTVPAETKNDPAAARGRRALRDIVEIDEKLCDGCGQCVPGCAEGALTMENGRVVLLGEALCDGLGACLGHCPNGALTVVRRLSDSFDAGLVDGKRAQIPAGRKKEDEEDAPEAKKRPDVSEPDSAGGPRLAPEIPREIPPKEQTATLGNKLGEADAVLEEETASKFDLAPLGGMDDLPEPGGTAETGGAASPSGGLEEPRLPGSRPLVSWPIQLALIPPKANIFNTGTVILAADCVAFASGDFRARFLAGGDPLAICCPKLDDAGLYVAKLGVILRDNPNVLEVRIPIMEVPCCRGLWRIAVQALEKSGRRDVSLSGWVVGRDGRGVEGMVNVALGPREA
ncbi:MAG: ferredoxin [Deltaproteobacteria bacterium]|jgi:ferredoxin|nr:ferredoxin [Deltaproteobacteria bacterium]